MKMSPVVRRDRRAYRPLRGIGSDLFDTISQLTNQTPVFDSAPASPSAWDFGPGNTEAQGTGWNFGPVADSLLFPNVNVLATSPSTITASPSYVSNDTTDWSKLISTALTSAATIYGAKTSADAQVEIAKAKAQSAAFNPFGVTDVNNPYGAILPYGATLPAGYRLPTTVPTNQLVPGISNDTLMYLGIGAVVLAVIASM